MTDSSFETYVRAQFARIDERLDRMNGRWWAVIKYLILGLVGLCGSLITYIWVHQI